MFTEKQQKEIDHVLSILLAQIAVTLNREGDRIRLLGDHPYVTRGMLEQLIGKLQEQV